jgi:hypothetical protein
MRVCSLRESVVTDIYALAAHLRDGDRAEVVALGLDPREAIRRCYRHAIQRKTYLVDGEIAAMSGLCGALLSDIGEPYLMTTASAAKMPVSFVRHARAAVAEMLIHRARLEGHVAASYRGACRLLEVLGFVLGQPLPLGPQGTLFRRYSMTRGV